jgi:hypothetical protein
MLFNKKDNEGPHYYNKGDRVRIIKGTYKGHLYGTFIRFSGSHKACVKVDNDNNCERNLNKTSIRHVSDRDVLLHGWRRAKGEEATNEGKDKNDGIDIEGLLLDLSAMKEAIEKMEIRLRAYERNK